VQKNLFCVFIKRNLLASEKCMWVYRYRIWSALLFTNRLPISRTAISISRRLLWVSPLWLQLHLHRPQWQNATPWHFSLGCQHWHWRKLRMFWYTDQMEKVYQGEKSGFPEHCTVILFFVTAEYRTSCLVAIKKTFRYKLLFKGNFEKRSNSSLQLISFFNNWPLW